MGLLFTMLLCSPSVDSQFSFLVYSYGSLQRYESNFLGYPGSCECERAASYQGIGAYVQTLYLYFVRDSLSVCVYCYFWHALGFEVRHLVSFYTLFFYTEETLFDSLLSAYFT